MREQNCRNARQPANEHRRVLAAVILLFEIHFVQIIFQKSRIHEIN